MGIYNALVRDNFPDIIKKLGGIPHYRKMNDVEFRNALKVRLVEEARQALNAPDRESLIEEIADVWEILNYLYDILGVDDDLIAKTAAKKRSSQGGFDKHILLESISNQSTTE